MHEEADLDVYYVEHMSPWLYLKMVALTPWALLVSHRDTHQSTIE